MSLTSKQVAPGVIIDITVAGNSGRFQIVSVEDGRVTLKHSGQQPNGQRKQRGRWWLDYDYVRAHGKRVALAQ